MSNFKQKHTGLFFGIGLLVLVLVSVSSFTTFRSYFRAGDLRKESFLRLNLIEKLLLEVTDAETGQRGYLITGRETYLKPFQTSVVELPALIAQLRNSAGSDHRQSELIDSLDKEVKTKIQELRSTLDARRDGGFAAARKVVDTDAGKRTMDEIRRIGAELTGQENRALELSETDVATGTRRSILVVVLGTALAFALVGGSALVTGRAMRQLEESEAKLIESLKDLTLSNRDLEQFAYVASHDLQEPLRMVSNYCQLLGRRYKGRLDSDADDFIKYAVDGAQRMQRLIDDLLAYSRVGSGRGKLVRIQVANSFQDALRNLESSIKESGAVITHDEFPELIADPNQLKQLFQNLIGNAIKFRGAGAPRIRVSVEKIDGEWRFGVHDNGIGIAPEYYNQIFVLFQRLNSKDEYPGTGIGLAICKKIMDTHGGKIWVDSKAGQGTTFYFTFPRNSAYLNK